jgi:branched-chain amino acid aminotransferase
MAGFSECFMTGTAAEVTPVAEIGLYRFAIGDIARALMADYSALVRPPKSGAARGEAERQLAANIAAS